MCVPLYTHHTHRGTNEKCSPSIKKVSFFSFNLQFFNLPFIAVESVLHRVIKAVLQFGCSLRLMLL